MGHLPENFQYIRNRSARLSWEALELVAYSLELRRQNLRHLDEAGRLRRRIEHERALASYGLPRRLPFG